MTEGGSPLPPDRGKRLRQEEPLQSSLAWPASTDPWGASSSVLIQHTACLTCRERSSCTCRLRTTESLAPKHHRSAPVILPASPQKKKQPQRERGKIREKAVSRHERRVQNPRATCNAPDRRHSEGLPPGICPQAFPIATAALLGRKEALLGIEPAHTSPTRLCILPNVSAVTSHKTKSRRSSALRTGSMATALSSVLILSQVSVPTSPLLLVMPLSVAPVFEKRLTSSSA